jgi:hypothetical protein
MYETAEFPKQSLTQYLQILLEKLGFEALYFH